MAKNAGLPSWCEQSGQCQYYSASQKKFHHVRITQIDNKNKQITVHFVADAKVWKSVPFSQIGKLLKPMGAEKAAARAVAKADESPPAKPISAAMIIGQPERSRRERSRTPPWYEQISLDEDRNEKKAEKNRQANEEADRKQARRNAWQEMQQKMSHDEQRRKTEEKQKLEEEAEVERLRIKQRLDQERIKEEHDRLLQVQEERRLFEEERRRKELERRLKEEEALKEQYEREVEELEQRRKKAEEIANRPRIGFGMNKTQGKISQPLIMQSQKGYAEHEAQQNAAIDGAQRQRQDESADYYQQHHQPDVAQHHSAGYAQEQQYSHSDRTGSNSTGNDNGATNDYVMEGLRAAAALRARQQGNEYQSQSVDHQNIPEHLRPVEPASHEHSSRPRESQATDSETNAGNLTTAQVDLIKERVRKLYEIHNPSKLDDVPSLFRKYAGVEGRMYDAICRKYNVEPEPLTEATPPPPQGRVARKAGAPSRPDSIEPPPTAERSEQAPDVGDLLQRYQQLLGGGEKREAHEDDNRAERREREVSRNGASSRRSRSRDRQRSARDGGREGRDGGRDSNRGRDSARERRDSRGRGYR